MAIGSTMGQSNMEANDLIDSADAPIIRLRGQLVSLRGSNGLRWTKDPLPFTCFQ